MNAYIRNRCRNSSLGCVWSFMTKRWMTKSKRVQDRSKLKRVHDLEIVTEKWKILSKVLLLIDVLRKEPEQIITLRNLEQYRTQINLRKPHKVCDFIRKSPKLFELYRDPKGVIWCGLTNQAEDLLEEEHKLLAEHGPRVAEYVTRFLMMSMNKMLPLDKIAHFRRDLGLPFDFRTKWVHEFPDLFKVVMMDDIEYLKLVSWKPDWAFTELERKSMNGVTHGVTSPGLLSLAFPMKFPSTYKKLFRYGGKIEHFQKRTYLSPYAEAKDLTPGSQEFDKRAVAIMHEMLSFTMEKRLVTDHLTHFRREFVMPQKLMRLLLKHFGIFYVSERGKRFNVFLTEAYDGANLIEKCPLVLWREKIQRLIGYRGRQRRLESFGEFSDVDVDVGDLLEGVNGGENAFIKSGEEGDATVEEESLNLELLEDTEMNVTEIRREYEY